MDTLGVDIGGVIIDRVNDNTDTSFFGDNYLATTATAGVFEALARLVGERFGDRVYLVSKCGQRVQDKSLDWLTHHGFYERTGISPDHVRFCRERLGKAPIAKELGLTHFIDDRMSVLRHMAAVPYRILFMPTEKEHKDYQRQPQGIAVVWSWKNLLDNTHAILGPSA